MLLCPIQLGDNSIELPLVLSPMAGVTDKPMRRVCRRNGAGYTVAEMLTSDQSLWNTRKSSLRMDIEHEPILIGIQIAGSDPGQLADAARACVDRGALIIDINMGCPAKKVCRRWAGSALMQDEALVGQILEVVVNAVDVPVTLKIRTGWHRDHVNGVAIARIAEQSGIQMLAVHGRTRDMMYKGSAEYATIREIKRTVGIPVLANGDIDSPERALEILRTTGVDGLMIGRGAQGRPWIFSQVAQYLNKGEYSHPGWEYVRDTMLSHVSAIHEYYGEYAGVRVARKHLGWYAANYLQDVRAFRQAVMRQDSSTRQLQVAADYFDRDCEIFSGKRSSSASIQWRTGTSDSLAR